MHKNNNRTNILYLQKGNMLMKIKFFESNQNDNRPDDKKISIFPKGEEKNVNKKDDILANSNNNNLIEEENDNKISIQNV